MLKGKHWHIVLDCPNSIPLSTIAKWFGVPENAVEIPSGRGAFLDCVEYLTHKTEKCIREEKTPYDDEEVFSNFDWQKELLEREENKLKYGGDLSKKDRMLFDVLYLGKTLKECQAEDKLLYMNNLEKLKKFRVEYITNNMEVPKTRLNIYITGKGGVGKDVSSRAIARALYPEIENDEDLFFEVGADNATYEGYDGQPVLIWSEYRAYTLLEAFKGRENLFKIFDTHPHNARVNIKFGSVKLVNTVNIVNSVEDRNVFLDGLAGEYVDKAGNLRTAEDKGQSYRRFPIDIGLSDEEITIRLSKYFTNESNDPQEFEIWKRIKGNFRKIRALCKGNEEKARFYENKILTGLPEKIKELLANEQELTDAEIDAVLSSYGEEIIEEPKKEESKKQVNKIKVDDCVIAYTGSGSNYEFDSNSCIIPNKYKSYEQMKEIIEKFETEKSKKEAAEKEKEEAAKQKAKEEEARKTALQGADLLDWLDNAKKEVENNQTLEDDFYNDSGDNDFFG